MSNVRITRHGEKCICTLHSVPHCRHYQRAVNGDWYRASNQLISTGQCIPNRHALGRSRKRNKNSGNYFFVPHSVRFFTKILFDPFSIIFLNSELPCRKLLQEYILNKRRMFHNIHHSTIRHNLSVPAWESWRRNFRSLTWHIYS